MEIYDPLGLLQLTAATPGTLHWFMWEATTTWISGAVLMGMVYYPESMLIDVHEMTYAAGATAGLGVIFGGYVLYSLILRTPVARSDIAMAVLALLLLPAAHYGLLQVQSTRAAFFHIGALLGTIMAFNVVMGIIPAQKKMLKAIADGNEPDPKMGKLGPLRSKHNSYMAIPLVFIMISNHYPTISYGSQVSTWLLTGIVAIGFFAARLIRGM